MHQRECSHRLRRGRNIRCLRGDADYVGEIEEIDIVRVFRAGKDQSAADVGWIGRPQFVGEEFMRIMQRESEMDEEPGTDDSDDDKRDRRCLIRTCEVLHPSKFKYDCRERGDGGDDRQGEKGILAVVGELRAAADRELVGLHHHVRAEDEIKDDGAVPRDKQPCGEPPIVGLNECHDDANRDADEKPWARLNDAQRQRLLGTRAAQFRRSTVKRAASASTAPRAPKPPSFSAAIASSASLSRRLRAASIPSAATSVALLRPASLPARLPSAVSSPSWSRMSSAT